MDWDNVVADRELLLTNHINYGRSAAIDKIVLHHNGGNLSLDDAYQLWQYNREASAHYQIDSDGLIGQYVNDWDTAWHAGNANPSSIGIEHANDNFDPWTISQATLESGAHLVAALCKMYGLGEPQWCVNVFPHSYFMATACPGEIAGSQNEQYMNRAREWYAAMTGGAYVPAEPTPAPVQPNTSDVGVSVTLQAWSRDQGILPAVTNNEDDAGDGSPVLYLSAWTSAGVLDVQANDLPVLKNPSNINDTENGAVGNGTPITKLSMFFWSPNNDLAIFYRAMVNGIWLPWMKDHTDLGGSSDNYAGNGVDPIQRVEAYIDRA